MISPASGPTNRAGPRRRRGSSHRGQLSVALCAAISIACAVPAFAAGEATPRLAPAQEALSAGHYAEAYELYRAAADQSGDALAAFTVGLFHQLGWGRPVDRVEACRWFLHAGTKHIPAAEHFTGDCLRAGQGSNADPVAAMTWYERAVQDGYPMSLCSMGEMYVAGEGVARDRAKGRALCLQAASGGLHAAQARLARLYLEDNPTAADYDEARRWLTVAAQGGYAEAQYWLATMYRDGLGRVADVTAARYWFEQAASHGYLPAYLPTARLYWDAPPALATGQRDAAAIAKSYLWTSALIRRTPPPLRQPEAEALLAEIRAEMPPKWTGELDRKIDAHVREVTQGPAGDPRAQQSVAAQAAPSLPAAR